ncbi:MAG: DUF362 domain-containing protein [Endomicrobiales bacterium]
MSSPVYFLPQAKLRDFPEWIKTTGAFSRLKEREFVAIKIHFGEKGNTGFVKPKFARAVAEQVQQRGASPFLTDANTIYVGQRADAVHHLQVAANHGFTQGKCGCPIIIADGLRGNAGVDVEVNLKHFQKVSIANAVHYADSVIFINHLKGHELTGFGGMLKNAGMGCGTRAGKYAMHDKLKPRVAVEKCASCGECIKWCSGRALTLGEGQIVLDREECVGCGECILSCAHNVFSIPWDETTSGVQERIVEYAYGVLKDKPHFGITFVNHLTRYCDCYPTLEGPLLGDLGVLASADPVALDQAGADLVNRAYGGDFWKHLFPHIDWSVQLDYAEKLGLGKRHYTLIE